MKFLKKATPLLTLLLCFTVFASTVYGADSTYPKNALILKTGGAGNATHVVTDWGKLKEIPFGNGDTLELSVDNLWGMPKAIVVPKEITNLKVKGVWMMPLILQGDMTLELCNEFYISRGIIAEKDLALNISGPTVVEKLLAKDEIGYPIEVRGQNLTIDGQGILAFRGNTSYAETMIYGPYSKVNYQGATLSTPEESDTLFESTGDLTFIQDGGQIKGGGIKAKKNLQMIMNGGMCMLKGSDSFGNLLNSSLGKSVLTMYDGYLKATNTNKESPYDLMVDEATFPGGNIEGRLKCAIPKELLAWSYTPEKTKPFTKVDIYNDAGVHHPALLDGYSSFRSYFTEGQWHVNIDGQDAGSFVVDKTHPVLVETVQLRLDSMQNDETLDLRNLNERRDEGQSTICYIPEQLTAINIIGNASEKLNMSLEAKQQVVPMKITLQDIQLNGIADKVEEAFLGKMGSADIELKGVAVFRRPLASTNGGSIKLRTVETTLEQPEDSVNAPLIQTFGNTSLFIEQGTYTIGHQLMAGEKGAKLEYTQNAGTVKSSGKSFIKAVDDLNVSLVNGVLETGDSGVALTSDGTLLYKQSSGQVKGGALLKAEVTQFAMINGEMTLGAKDAISGKTVNAYLGGGVLTIDGVDGFAMNSEKTGAYIQRGGTIISKSTNGAHTLNIDKHFIDGGNVFATFADPINEGKEVLYKVQNQDGTLAALQDIIVRGPLSFEARTNEMGLLHMYLPEGSYEVIQGDTVIGTFDARDNQKKITSWQQLDEILKNTDWRGIRDNDIVDISAMSSDRSGTHNIALPPWLNAVKFVSAPGKFIDAQFTLVEGRDKALALTVENMYLRPKQGHAIDIAQPMDIGGSTLILAGDNSIQLKEDITAAGIHVEDITWKQSDEWFAANPGDVRVLNALTIDALTDDSGKSASLLINCEAVLGAAIGGGMYESAGDITIKNGNIQAIGSEGAGIGGGSKYGEGGKITINGGYITAESMSGSPIGGGSNADGGTISINGGNVTCINRNTESDGTIIGSLGYARGFTSFAPGSSKDSVLSETKIQVQSCNLRSYNHEKSELPVFAAKTKDLATAEVKMTFLGNDNKPLSDYGIVIRNVDSGEILTTIRTWRTDGKGSAGLVYMYLPDGRYQCESATDPSNIATSVQHPDGILSAGQLVNIEGVVLKFK